MDLTGVQAVLLDMDGTLVDSDAVVERVWRARAREHDMDLDGGMALVHGSPAERTIRRPRPDLPDAAVAAEAARLRALEYDDVSDVVATPNAAELLSMLGRPGVGGGDERRYPAGQNPP
jgi:sugar-phosphatase